MKGKPGILSQVAGLALAAILSVLIVSFAILLTLPNSSLAEMTLGDALAALRGNSVAGLRREVVQTPPRGRLSPLLASSVSRALGVAENRVQAVWLETPVAAEAPEGAQAVTLLAGWEAVVEVRAGGFVMHSGSAANLRSDTRVPPFAVAVQTDDGQWLTISPREQFLTASRLHLILTFLVSALLLAPLVLLVARQLTRPIRALADAAERVRLAPVQEPVALSGPKEIQIAAAALNAMRDRLLDEVAQRTRMLAAIAHDLRNPLTGLRMRVENAPEPERSCMIADLDRMAAMIAQVLDYARGREERAAMIVADPGQLVRDWLLERPHGDAPILVTEIQSGHRILCAPEELRRAFTNLLDNALRFAGGACVSVVAEGREWVILRIDDEGPGIEPAEVKRLLKPFERLEPSRSSGTGGVGLGLAICRDIAEAHGGRLELAPREPKGLSAAIKLPLRGWSKPAGR